MNKHIMIFLASIFTTNSAIASSTLETRQTQIFGIQTELISRNETYLRNLPLNSDIKMHLEETSDVSSYNIRAQILPATIGNIKLGIVGRLKGESNTKGKIDPGLGARYDAESISSRLRFYPVDNSFQSKTVIEGNRVYSDLVINYNYNEGKVTITPGIDWKITNEFATGLETEFDTSNPSNNYYGLRIRYSLEIIK